MTTEITSINQVVVTETAANVVEVQVPGPQGPSGEATGSLPTGGDPGNVLLKSSGANYDANWAATVDGGTFA
jgi:hypothetical protein